MNYKIDKATIDDLETIDLFQIKLARFESKLDNLTRRNGKIRYYTKRKLQSILSSDRSGCLIAKIDDVPAGFCLFEVKKNPARICLYKEKGYIGLLYVERRYRREGIGSVMLEETIKHFKEIGLQDIRINVLSCNDSAIKTYEKKGFSHRVIEMIYDGNN